MESFKESEIYKKALKEYQENIFGEILNPLHTIVLNFDDVYLFYNQSIVGDIFSKMKEIFNKERDDESTNFPISLGYEEPCIKYIKFMGNEYAVINLWYDKYDPPKVFEARL